MYKSEDLIDMADLPPKTPNETTEVNYTLASSPDQRLSFGDANSRMVESRGSEEREDDHLDLPEGYKCADSEWGGRKPRAFKHRKLGIPMASPVFCTSSRCLEPQKDQNYADKMSEEAPKIRNALDILMDDNPVQTPTSNFNTSFCLNMAICVLLRKAEEGSNFVFSPLSFHLMLCLIAVGLTGSTLDRLLSFLESESIEKLNSLASQVATSVLFPANESRDLTNTRGPIVSFVNGAWVDLRFQLKTSFKKVVEGVYHAAAKEADFVNKADQVINEVNSWAENATKGLIQNLLPQDCLDKNTVLVLANALYFKGTWDRKFDASKTTQKEFHLLNGHIVQVPFMTCKKYQRHLYGSFDGLKVLKLPYQKDQNTSQLFCMYFFLPDANDGLHNLIQMFKSNPELYSKQFNLKEEDLPQFWIPRFKFSFKFEASKTMKELGLDVLFSDVGRFTEMVDPSESLALSKIFHESCIEVNEEGTEAAASTAPRLIKRCRWVHPPSFVADHPFMFMVKEENSGVVFFIGAVLNPLLVS